MTNLSKGQQLLLALVIELLVVALLPHLHLNDYLSFFIFILFSIVFFFSLGKSIPIKALMVVIASIQWLIGPVLAYHYYPNSEFYYMVISEQKYMSYVLPGITAFIIGLFIFSGKESKNAQRSLNEIFANPKEFFRKGIVLIMIGYIATIVEKIGVPPSLKYFVLLLSYFKEIGAFYVFASGARSRWVWIILAFGLTVATALSRAMFHDLILWSGYLFILYTFIQKTKFTKKLTISLVIVFGVFMIQTIKKEYRAVVWNPQTQMQNINNLDLAASIAQQQLDEGSQGVTSESNMQRFVTRINQGWIIARILYTVPDYEPFANGETIMQGLEGAFVPRFLDPNKIKAGGHENFTRFTGVQIQSDTSMNLSILGEAYANYGINGGILFMFILGLFYNLVYKIIISRSRKAPELIFWLPFVFYYCVKAEGDFATAINQLVKSVFVLIVMLFVLKQLFPESSKSVKSSEA